MPVTTPGGPTTMLSLITGARTHRGLVRQANEDAVFSSARFAAVADGLGGHVAGEVASRIAVECVAELSERAEVGPQDIAATVAEANHRILDHGESDPACAGMGTTLAGIGLIDVEGVDRWAVFNVGDSRVYRYADGALSQVTVDHSEVVELVQAGHLTAEQALAYPRRNVVTRSLGSVPAPQPDLWVFPPTPGERFLVCSDGLTLEVDDGTIAAILGGIDDVETAAATLVEAALSGGGRDNVTVVVVVAVPDAGDDTVPLGEPSAGG